MRDAAQLVSDAEDGVLVFNAKAPADPCVLVLPRWTTKMDGDKCVVVPAVLAWGVYVVSPNWDGSVGIAFRTACGTIEEATAAGLEVWNSEERPKPL